MEATGLDKEILLRVSGKWNEQLKKISKQMTDKTGIVISIQDLIRIAIREKYNFEGGSKKRIKILH